MEASRGHKCGIGVKFNATTASVLSIYWLYNEPTRRGLTLSFKAGLELRPRSEIYKAAGSQRELNSTDVSSVDASF